jgi:hypothetical protein
MESITDANRQQTLNMAGGEKRKTVTKSDTAVCDQV